MTCAKCEFSQAVVNLVSGTLDEEVQWFCEYVPPRTVENRDVQYSSHEETEADYECSVYSGED